MRVPKLKFPAPNRLAVYMTSLAGLAAALAPVLANLDVTSTVGLVGGVGAISAVVVKWLDGWQKHEAREAAPAAPAVPVTTDPATIAAAVAVGLEHEIPGATEGVKPAERYAEAASA